MERMKLVDAAFTKAQADAVRMAPDDPAHAVLGDELLAMVDELTDIRDGMASERDERVAWCNEVTKGFTVNALFGGTMQRLRDQVTYDTQTYDEMIDIINDGIIEWIDWLKGEFGSRGPEVRDGMRVCSAGHENHISRSECGVCGEYLFA